jgi:SAM-dependent methyltransferase
MRLLSSIGHAFAHVYWREEAIVAHLRPYLSDSARLLDIGAGGCRVAKIIGRQERIEVTPIDVVDHNVTDVPLMLYDGMTLPFDDKSFDVSLLIFVLHHAVAPHALLREAIRVTRSTILIVEDVPGNFLEKVLWRAWDYVLNHGAHEDVSVAHRARDLTGWVQFLDHVGAPPTVTLTFRMSFPVLRSYPHALLVVPLAV